MQDRVLALLVVVPVLFILLILGTMIVVTSDEGGTSNPIGAIPKVIIDHVEGETVVTVMGVHKHRYDQMYINHTVGNETHNVSGRKRYALDSNISANFFDLNVTVVSGEDHYIFNCTMEVQEVTANEVYLLIREEDETSFSRHRSPYTLLAEWRDVT